MHHTLAWFEDVGPTANTDVQPVSDDVISIVNNHFFPGQDYDLVYAFVASATLTRARFANPSMRQVVEPQIRPISAALLPVTDPNVMDLRRNPFRIRRLEEMVLEITSGVAMTENLHALAGLQTRFVPVPAGDIYTIRGTSTTAAVADVWTSITVTWDATLPAGVYACVGATVVATNEIGFRLIFENQVERPGGVAIPTVGSRPHDMFTRGGLGVWGNFSSTRMPTVQVFNDTTDNAHTVYLDFVRVSQQPTG